MGCHFLLQETSLPRDQTLDSALAGGFFTTEPPEKECQFSPVQAPFYNFVPNKRIHMQIYVVYVEVAVAFPDTLKVSGPYYSPIVSGDKYP